MGSGGRPTALARIGSFGSQRHLFDVPDEVAYFNTANLSPLLRRVREAGELGLARRASPWNISARDWFTDVDRLRAHFAALIGASEDGVALVPATSYGLAIAARSLGARPGEDVVVLAGEFPSSHYTWQRFARRTGAALVVVEREAGQSWTEATVGRIGDRTRVVAVPNVHWTNGALLDLEMVSAAARAAGAALCIDASQSLGALPLDLNRLRPDFVVAVGYKWLLGPLSVGYLYVAEQHRDGEPLEENWINRKGADDFTSLVDYTNEYWQGARRFDVGERTNFGLVPMAIAALEQLLAWGIADVARALREITESIGERAAALGLTVPPARDRGPHMLGIGLPRAAAGRVTSALTEHGVVAGVRGTWLRISPHLHTTAADIDRLIAALSASG
jgi:selenocysteine lyase/cysteine desulfurase